MWKFISVVVPVYNPRKGYLEQCIESLLQLDYPNDRYEIIVVNDGSSNFCAKQFRSSLFTGSEVNIKFYTQVHQGVAVARNTGIQLAQGDLVAFTDSDCVADPGWLKAFSICFDDPMVGGVGGTTLSFSSQNYIEEYCDFFGSLRTPVLNNGDIAYLISANACWKKDILDEVAGFSERYEYFAKKGIIILGYTDLELSHKVMKRGYCLRFCQNAIIYHKHKRTLRERIRQFYNYGAGSAFLNFISERRILIPGRYQVMHPPSLWRIFLAVLQKFLTMLLQPFTYDVEKMRLDQRLVYPIFDFIQQVAFIAGYSSLYKRLKDVKD